MVGGEQHHRTEETNQLCIPGIAGIDLYTGPACILPPENLGRSETDCLAPMSAISEDPRYLRPLVVRDEPVQRSVLHPSEERGRRAPVLGSLSPWARL